MPTEFFFPTIFFPAARTPKPTDRGPFKKNAPERLNRLPSSPRGHAELFAVRSRIHVAPRCGRPADRRPAATRLFLTLKVRKRVTFSMRLHYNFENGLIASSSQRHVGDPPSTRPVVAPRRRALKLAKAVCPCAPPSQPLQPRIDGFFTPEAWHSFCAGTPAQAYLMGRAAYVPVRLHLQLFLQICGRAALCAQCRGRHLGNHCP